MADWKKIYQDYLDASDATRANLAKNAASEIMSYCRSAGFSSDDQCQFIIYCFKLFSCGDTTTQRTEHELFKAVTGTSITYQEYFDLTNYGGSEDFRSKMDQLIDSMSDDAKTNVLILGLCILTSDGKLTVSEQELFSRIMR